jgi:hypothetical protein
MKPLKTLLLWLLLLAIPIQGLANNALTICQTSHQRISQVVASDHSFDHHSIVGHDAKHYHHAMQHGDTGGSLSHDGEHGPDQQLSSCSACAACSIGALWLPGNDAVFPSILVPSTTVSSLAFHVPGVEPERPEHPPRVFLA